MLPDARLIAPLEVLLIVELPVRVTGPVKVIAPVVVILLATVTPPVVPVVLMLVKSALPPTAPEKLIAPVPPTNASVFAPLIVEPKLIFELVVVNVVAPPSVTAPE